MEVEHRGWIVHIHTYARFLVVLDGAAVSD